MALQKFGSPEPVIAPESGEEVQPQPEQLDSGRVDQAGNPVEPVKGDPDTFDS
jgi:hypothetical protein